MNKVIDTFLELLKEFKSLGIQNSINFEQLNEVLISHHSTAIEGSSLTEEETRLLLTEGLTSKSKPIHDHLMVLDHQNALNEVVKLAKEKGSQISPEMIQHLSSLVLKNTGKEINSPAGTYDSSKGEYRKSMVYVGVRYFANYQKVPDLVNKLCKEINTRLNLTSTPEDIYNLAFDAHFELVSIHPFADGNGRVSRLLMNYILEYKKQPMAIIFTEDKLEYYKALEDTRTEENMKPFRDFMYSQQCKLLEQEIHKVKSQLKPGKGFGMVF